jgi:hypothetical protein
LLRLEPSEIPLMVLLVRPALLRVPVRVGVKVCVLLKPTMVSPAVNPLKEDVVVAKIWVPPVCVCPRGPSAVIPEPFVESVVPVSVRPLPTVRELSALVPLPKRIPVSVVEPVPPFPTPKVPVRRLVPIEVVATTAPEALVERRELGREVMAREVVVALRKFAFANCEVEEANIPL